MNGRNVWFESSHDTYRLFDESVEMVLVVSDDDVVNSLRLRGWARQRSGGGGGGTRSLGQESVQFI